MRPNFTIIGQFVSLGLVLSGARIAEAQTAPPTAPPVAPPAATAAPESGAASTPPVAADAATAPEASASSPETTAEPSPEEGAAGAAATPAPEGPEKPAVDEPLPRIVYVKTDPSAAKEPAPASAPSIDARKVPWTYHLQHFDAAFTVALGWVPDSSFDLFSDGDLLVGLGARVGGTVATFGHFGLAVVGDWNYASAEGRARGVSTALGQHRIQLGVEGRYYFLPAVHAYGRLSGGVAYLDARIGSDGAFSALYDDTWEGVGSVMVGGAVRMFGEADGRVRGPRLHVAVEGGYAVVAETALSLLPSEDGPLRPEPFVYDGLRMSGPVVGAAFVLTY